MCGIAGLLSADATREQLVRASRLLRHRGPDDAGFYEGAGAALATRRLSIIDVSGGRQPLSNEDRSVWITFNGEIVNAPDLRRALETAGHAFQTESDTEVIVHAYEQWGRDAVTRLRGMFAFGLWDEKRERLLLARDHFGIKPLYYGQQGDRFAFASEIEALFALLPGMPRRANHLALWRMFELGYTPSPLTPIAGIDQLPAAHILAVEKGQITLNRYWQLHFPSGQEYRSISAAEATGEFARRLQETVAAWRLSDVPVGSLLSGGVDSASLAALLTELTDSPVHTFSIGFSAASHDERADARATARVLGSRHHELIFEDDDFDKLPRVVRRLQSPQCSATSVALYALYQACHEAGFKVIMTGEGADELLGGYHWFDGDRRVRPLLRAPRLLRNLVVRLPLPVSAGGRRVLARGSAAPAARYALWQETGQPGQRRSLLQVGGAPPIHRQWADEHGEALNGRHPLNQFIYLDSQTRMVDFINFEIDRMSMAHSVEARPPFLDHKLWQFCAGLPPSLKLTSGGNKLLLRKAMAGRLPRAVRARPKQGLATPHAAWWRRDRLPAWAEEALHPVSLAQTDLFHTPTVSRLRQEHQQGVADHSRLLMGVLTTQIWCDVMEVSD